MRLQVIGMWIWLVAALILGFIIISSNRESTETRPSEFYLDEDDELIEEFLIIDLLEEEES